MKAIIRVKCFAFHAKVTYMGQSVYHSKATSIRLRVQALLWCPRTDKCYLYLNTDGKVNMKPEFGFLSNECNTYIKKISVIKTHITGVQMLNCQAQPKPQVNKIGLSQPYFLITGPPPAQPPARPEQQRSKAASKPSLIIQDQFTQKDYLNGRRPHWKTTLIEDDINGR